MTYLASESVPPKNKQTLYSTNNETNIKIE